MTASPGDESIDTAWRSGNSELSRVLYPSIASNEIKPVWPVNNGDSFKIDGYGTEACIL